MLLKFAKLAIIILAFSAIASAQIKVAPVITNKVPAVPAASITVSWTASITQNVTYNVSRGTAPKGPFTPIASGLTTTSYVDNTVVVGTEYFYQIDTILSDGTTSAGLSPVVNATVSPAKVVPVTAQPVQQVTATPSN
jgi:fibronectin type 3 domain-containing protein